MKYKELCKKLANAIEELDNFKNNKRALKNNNPGNLWDGKEKRVYKNTQIDDDGFLIFPTYEKGRSYFERDILLNILSGKTLETYTKTFTNDEKYLNSLERLTEINRNQKLKDLIK